MDFNIMRIRRYGDRSNPYLYPVIDGEGHFVGEEGDHSAAALEFSNVKIKRNAETVYESEHGLDGKLFITDSRVVLMSENYQSGNIIWAGGLVGAVIASAASDAMARQRTSQTVLTGHIRYEWLDDVVASSEKYLLGLLDETITLTYPGSEHAMWSVSASLKNVEGIATKTRTEILRRVAQFKQEPLSPGQGQTKKPYQLPAINATSPSNLMYCSHCGGQIKESDAYCKYCGVKQSVS